MSRPIQTVTAMGSATLTDLNGRFEQTGVEPGKYRVLAYRRGGGTAIVENVQPGDTVELEMPAVGGLSGTVVDAAGEPPETFMLFAMGSAVSSRGHPIAGTAGEWEITGLEAGPYVVQVTTDTGSAYETITLAPGEYREGIELRLTEIASVSGRVVFPGKRPLYAWVTASLASDPQGHSLALSTSMDDDGRFIVRPVPAEPILLHYHAVPKKGVDEVVRPLTTCKPEAGTTLELGAIPVGE
jgi:hypothetical protein